MRAVEAETFPDVATIVVAPARTSVATPVLLIVATEVLDDVHDTPALMSFTVPSLKSPVAENWTEPCATAAVTFWGVTSMETNGDVVIVTVVEPEIPSSLAETVADPDVMAVATPEELMNSTETFEEVHIGPDRTFFDPSCYVAFASNCCVAPVRIDGAGGVTEIDVIGTCQNSSHDTHKPSNEIEKHTNNP